jgi:Holliday junction resolvase RusA-like endonuclease
VTVSFYVPGPPRGKGRPRSSRASGRVYTPAETASYENLIKVTAMLAMAGQAPIEGPVTLTMIACLPIPASMSKKKRLAMAHDELKPAKRPDLDNILKALLDGINGVVFHDDVQVIRIVAEKQYDALPGLQVMVWPV